MTTRSTSASGGGDAGAKRLLHIRHATVVVPTIREGGVGFEVLPQHRITIAGGLIEAILPEGRAVLPPGEVVDAHDGVVLPGFINAHTHFYSALARGLVVAPAHDFADVLTTLWWRLDKALTPEDVHISALVSCIDAIRHGTTTVIDHHASPHAVAGSLATIADAVRATGIRACLCYEVSDRDGPDIARAGIEENASFIRACTTADDGMIRALFGLHASFTLSDATLEAACAAAGGTAFHIHVAEDAVDQRHARQASGVGVVERLATHGILRPGTIAAHGVHLDPLEREILADRRTSVVHNPQSNLNNAVGTADTLALVRAGVTLGLGTDAMTADMTAELRVAVWAQHALHGDPAQGFGESVLALMAGNPRIAAGAGLPAGGMHPGAAADIVILPYDPPTPMTADTMAGHLVFGLSQSRVSTTIVNGHVLMHEGRLCNGLDEAMILARARECAARLWRRL